MLYRGNKYYNKAVRSGTIYDKMYRNGIQYGGASAPVGKTFERFLDHAFYAENAIPVSGSLVSGAIIESIPCALTDKVCTYGGQESPSLGRPYFLQETDSRYSSIVFQNEENVFFRDADGGSYPPPQEFTMVMREMPGVPYEPLSNDTYLANTNKESGPMRTVDSSGWLDNPGAPKLFEVSIVHCKVTISGGVRTGMVWINGEYIGQADVEGGWNRSDYTIGAVTNCDDHDLMAKLYINGELSDSDRNTYMKELNDYYSPGMLPNKPYASNVLTWGLGDDNYEARYNYNGVNSENVAGAVIEWWELLNEGQFTHNKIGTGKTIEYSGSNSIRPSIKVADVNGNVWDRFVTRSY